MKFIKDKTQSLIKKFEYLEAFKQSLQNQNVLKETYKKWFCCLYPAVLPFAGFGIVWTLYTGSCDTVSLFAFMGGFLSIVGAFGMAIKYHTQKTEYQARLPIYNDILEALYTQENITFLLSELKVSCPTEKYEEIEKFVSNHGINTPAQFAPLRELFSEIKMHTSTRKSYKKSETEAILNNPSTDNQAREAALRELAAKLSAQEILLEEKAQILKLKAEALNSEALALPPDRSTSPNATSTEEGLRLATATPMFRLNALSFTSKEVVETKSKYDSLKRVLQGNKKVRNITLGSIALICILPILKVGISFLIFTLIFGVPVLTVLWSIFQKDCKYFTNQQEEAKIALESYVQKFYSKTNLAAIFNNLNTHIDLYGKILVESLIQKVAPIIQNPKATLEDKVINMISVLETVERLQTMGETKEGISKKIEVEKFVDSLSVEASFSENSKPTPKAHELLSTKLETEVDSTVAQSSTRDSEIKEMSSGNLISTSQDKAQYLIYQK